MSTIGFWSFSAAKREINEIVIDMDKHDNNSYTEIVDNIS